jgi:hypothetical protein
MENSMAIRKSKLERVDDEFHRYVMDYKVKNDIASFRQATKDIAKMLRMKKFKNEKIKWEVKF